MAQSIALTITGAGIVALLDFLRHCNAESIVALSFSETEGHCEIGAFNKEKIPPSEVQFISGLPFVFKDDERHRFNGRTLDYRAGVFCVDLELSNSKAYP